MHICIGYDDEHCKYAYKDITKLSVFCLADQNCFRSPDNNPSVKLKMLTDRKFQAPDNLRQSNLLNLRTTNTKSHGKNLLTFEGSILLNTLLDMIKIT